jgi:hypothetical protein
VKIERPGCPVELDQRAVATGAETSGARARLAGNEVPACTGRLVSYCLPTMTSIRALKRDRHGIRHYFASPWPLLLVAIVHLVYQQQLPQS